MTRFRIEFCKLCGMRLVAELWNTCGVEHGDPHAPRSMAKPSETKVQKPATKGPAEKVASEEKKEVQEKASNGILEVWLRKVGLGLRLSYSWTIWTTYSNRNLMKKI